MTKYHSDDYIKFLRSIRPDNMSEYSKQMQRCECPLFSQWALQCSYHPRAFNLFVLFFFPHSQCRRGLSRVRWSLWVLPALNRWICRYVVPTTLPIILLVRQLLHRGGIYARAPGMSVKYRRQFSPVNPGLMSAFQTHLKCGLVTLWFWRLGLN